MSAQSHLASMSLREKCAQMIFVAHPLEDSDPDLTSELVRKAGVGGMLLSGGSVFEVPSFVNWAQKVAKFPLLMASDFDRGGAVSGMTAYPTSAEIAATGSADFAQTRARHLGLEARALGIRMLIVPADDPHARVAVDGYRYAKVAVCVRQFPGAGVAELAAEADAILVGHQVVPDLDDEAVASRSRAAIMGSIRREMRFEGLVVTDALADQGVGPEVFEQAANAGADVLLQPGDPTQAIDALEAGVKAGRVAESTIDRAVTRLLLRKERMGLFADRMTDVSAVEQVVGAPAHRAAAERMAQAVDQAKKGGPT